MPRPAIVDTIVLIVIAIASCPSVLEPIIRGPTIVDTSVADHVSGWSRTRARAPCVILWPRLRGLSGLVCETEPDMLDRSESVSASSAIIRYQAGEQRDTQGLHRRWNRRA